MASDYSALKNLQNPELTTLMLMGAFSEHTSPRKKISSLAQKKLILPIKQGIYLVDEQLRTRFYSNEIFANLIYGPSYVSLETALSHYGFIPERVVLNTSICLGRGKKFSTPIGDFHYYHVKPSIYSAGIQLKEVFTDTCCLYASPEKALLDFIYIRESKGEFKNPKEYFSYLVESYRFDLDTIQKSISLKKLNQFAELYPFQKIEWFTNELTKRLIK